MYIFTQTHVKNTMGGGGVRLFPGSLDEDGTFHAV